MDERVETWQGMDDNKVSYGDDKQKCLWTM